MFENSCSLGALSLVCSLALKANIFVLPDTFEKNRKKSCFLFSIIQVADNGWKAQEACSSGKRLNGVLITQLSLTIQLLSFNIIPASNLEVYFYISVHGHLFVL